MATSREIEKMLRDYAKSPEGKKQISSGIKLDSSDIASINVHTQKAIHVLETLICNYAPPSISHAMSLVEVHNLINTTTENDGTYVINVDFRKSLLQRTSFSGDGVYDIAGLFTKGWDIDPDKRRVWGIWHSEIHFNKLHKDPDNFIQRAVDAFMSTYADEFGVTECVIDPRYLPG